MIEYELIETKRFVIDGETTIFYEAKPILPPAVGPDPVLERIWDNEWDDVYDVLS